MELRFQRLAKLFFIGASAIALLGCAAQSPISSQSTTEKTTRHDSEFDRFSVYSGPEVFLSVPRGILSDRVRWRLQSVVDKPTGAKIQKLLVSIWHQDKTWRFYQSASFIGGDLVDAKKVSSDPSCSGGGGLVSCTFTEVVSITLPTERWAESISSGLSIRVNAKNGPSVTIQVTKEYAQGFAAALPKK